MLGVCGSIANASTAPPSGPLLVQMLYLVETPLARLELNSARRATSTKTARVLGPGPPMPRTLGTSGASGWAEGPEMGLGVNRDDREVRMLLVIEFLNQFMRTSYTMPGRGQQEFWLGLCIFRRISDRVPILVGPPSDSFRTRCRFNSDSVPGDIRTVFRPDRMAVRNGLAGCRS